VARLRLQVGQQARELSAKQALMGDIVAEHAEGQADRRDAIAEVFAQQQLMAEVVAEHAEVEAERQALERQLTRVSSGGATLAIRHLAASRIAGGWRRRTYRKQHNRNCQLLAVAVAEGERLRGALRTSQGRANRQRQAWQAETDAMHRRIAQLQQVAGGGEPVEQRLVELREECEAHETTKLQLEHATERLAVLEARVLEICSALAEPAREHGQSRPHEPVITDSV
jgi:hypothetical protein